MLIASVFFVMTDKTPSYTRLNDSNFHEWSFFTEAILVHKDLMDIVDGTITCPLSSPNHKSVKAFIQKQKLACAEITLHVCWAGITDWSTILDSLH